MSLSSKWARIYRDDILDFMKKPPCAGEKMMNFIIIA